jgi:hypothetical protein
MLLLLGFVGLMVCATFLAIVEVFWPFTLVAVGLIAWGIWGNEAANQFMWSLLHWQYITPYVLVGLGWLFFKWTRVVDAALKDAKKYPGRELNFLPTWSEHSYDLAPHFFYWPMSVVAYVLHDLLFDLWDYISTMVAGVFNRYANYRFNTLIGASNGKDKID